MTPSTLKLAGALMLVLKVWRAEASASLRLERPASRGFRRGFQAAELVLLVRMLRCNEWEHVSIAHDSFLGGVAMYACLMEDLLQLGADKLACSLQPAGLLVPEHAMDMTSENVAALSRARSSSPSHVTYCDFADDTSYDRARPLLCRHTSSARICSHRTGLACRKRRSPHTTARSRSVTNSTVVIRRIALLHERRLCSATVSS